MDNVVSLISLALTGALNLLCLRAKEYATAMAIAVAIIFGFGAAVEIWSSGWPIRIGHLCGLEVKLLVLQSLVVGLYFGIRNSQSGLKAAGTGAALALFGVAYPIYGKILVLFGSVLLLQYLERVHRCVGLLGLLVSIAALLWKSADRVLKNVADDML
jgi:hypothetical protein